MVDRRGNDNIIIIIASMMLFISKEEASINLPASSIRAAGHYIVVILGSQSRTVLLARKQHKILYR